MRAGVVFNSYLTRIYGMLNVFQTYALLVLLTIQGSVSLMLKPFTCLVLQLLNSRNLANICWLREW